MKRYGYLYDKICSMDNLRLAHKNASQGKGWYKEIKRVNADPDRYLTELQTMLVNHTYRTSEYTSFKRQCDRKTRTIYKLPYFPDRICQWAVMQVISPYLLRTFIRNTYSAIPERGPHLTLRDLKRAMWYDSGNCTYCLKFDVKHYYPSITHSLLKLQLRRMFKDRDLLWLMDEIIDSIATATPEDAGEYPDFDVGIPIGNYVSQWCGNTYLTNFDYWIKQRVPYYFRYMDDMVILHKSKKFLHELRVHVTEYLKDVLHLTVKSNWQIFPSFVRGIDFIGYRVFAGYVLLRKSTAIRFKRRMMRLWKKAELTEHDFRVIEAYKGILKHCNSYGLKRKYLTPLVSKGVTL